MPLDVIDQSKLAGHSLDVLLVEDNPDDAELVNELLTSAPRNDFRVRRVDRLNDAFHHVKDSPVDVILLDLSLPDTRGIETLSRALKVVPHVPIIVVTGDEREQTAVDSVRVGAQDYLVKGDLNPRHLMLTVVRAVERHRSFLKLKHEQQQAQRQATHDGLTGLPNRDLLSQHLEKTVALAERYGGSLSVIFVDLDRFKLFNDTHGHAAGDELLKTVASTLRGSVRASDLVARVGGDEFVIVLPDTVLARDAARVARSVLTQLARLDVLGTALTASLGISFFPEDSIDAKELLVSADKAMYKAKEKGGNRFQFFSPELHFLGLRHESLEGELKTALEEQQFVVHYQPQCDLTSGAVRGVEALLRWQHPRLGLIGPQKFIPLAEESNLVVSIGEWAFGEACRQVALWQRDGRQLRLGFNLSTRHVTTDGAVRYLETLSEIGGLRGSLIDVELSGLESGEVSRTAANLERLKRAGIRVIIDGFGDHSKSVNLFRHFQPDGVKLHRSLIRGVPGESKDERLASAVIEFGRALELEIAACGVETEQQVRWLMDQGCNLMQGFYLCPVLSPHAMREWLGKRD
ncbi:MAG TPA: EAL domain-containing protein [Vicinamibacteria bacterium]|nr:EAL domain-containing protein [Vicinamibacteria bacterium]